jgi:hypothetical protein
MEREREVFGSAGFLASSSFLDRSFSALVLSSLAFFFFFLSFLLLGGGASSSVSVSCLLKGFSSTGTVLRFAPLRLHCRGSSSVSVSLIPASSPPSFSTRRPVAPCCSSCPAAAGLGPAPSNVLPLPRSPFDFAGAPFWAHKLGNGSLIVFSFKNLFVGPLGRCRSGLHLWFPLGTEAQRRRFLGRGTLETPLALPRLNPG